MIIFDFVAAHLECAEVGRAQAGAIGDDLSRQMSEQMLTVPCMNSLGNVCTLLGMDERRNDLEGRLNSVCGSLNLLHGQLVELTVEVLEGDYWAGYGVRSPEHWLTWKTGLSPYRARDIVLLARRKAELPCIFQAFTKGLLAIDQVAVLARHARSWHDEELADLAQSMTVAQLSQVLARYRHHDDPNIVEPDVPGQRGKQAEDDFGPDDDDDSDENVTVACKFSDGETHEPIDPSWFYGSDSDADTDDVDLEAATADWLARRAAVEQPRQQRPNPPTT